jgi:DNA-binding transcriptional LysR family regulator
MNIRQLRQFVVLAETLNFRKAAEALHISQPPLSVAIRKLEEDFGTPLFERSTRSVKLTAAGTAALIDVRKAIEASEGIRGTLRIGSVGSATISLIPRMVPPFRAQFPGVEIVIREYPSTKIIEEVEKGGLDLGLIRTPIVGSYDVVSIPIEQDKFVAAVPSGHRLSSRSSIHLRELSNEAFISYSRGESTGINFAVANACRAAGFSPKIVHEATQIQAAVSLVAAGMGVALVPSLHSQLKNRKVRFLPLQGRSPSLEIGLATVYNSISETEIGKAFRDFCLRLLVKG